MAGALVAAGYFWQQAKLESRNVIAERKALEETAVLLNSDLAAAKEMLGKTEAELVNVQRSLAELQVLRAAEAGATTAAARATVDSAKARLESAKAKQEDPAEDAGDARCQVRRPAGNERLETEFWRLRKGPSSVSGTARFSVEPRGNDVVVSEEFQEAAAAMPSLCRTPPRSPGWRPPRRQTSAITTSIPGSDWKRDGNVEFSTKGIDRVMLMSRIASARSLIKISTDCSGK